MTVERTGHVHRATVKPLTKVKKGFGVLDISEGVLLFARDHPGLSSIPGGRRERKLNVVLPFCYPTRQQSMTPNVMGWMA